jgi:hypothetical protein
MTLTPEQRAAIYHDNIKKADCGVIALQSVTGLTYAEADELLTAHGYKGGAAAMEGTPRGTIEKSLRSIGYGVQTVAVEEGSTPSIFWMERHPGRFLLYTPGHVSTIVDGRPYNAGIGGSPLESVVKITPPKEDD